MRGPSRRRAGVEAPVPDASALEAFLGAYTTDPSRFASDDVLAAAAMIKRREAKAAWDSEAGRRLLALNPGFETAARRRAPPCRVGSRPTTASST